MRNRGIRLASEIRKIKYLGIIYKMDNYDPSLNYVEMLEELWKDKRTGNSSGYSDCLSYNKESPEWKNEVSYKLVVATIGARLRQQQAYQKIVTEIDAKVNGQEKNNDARTYHYFVTIGFSEELFTIEKFKGWWNKMTGKAKILNAKGVIERHSESGVNTHCHMIIESPMKKGRMLQFIWESWNMQKLVGHKQVIDVMFYDKERHDKYIEGDKKADKMEYVIKDREWRKEFNLPEILYMGNI